MPADELKTKPLSIDKLCYEVYERQPTLLPHQV